MSDELKGWDSDLRLRGWFVLGLLNAGLMFYMVLMGSWLWPLNLFVTMYAAIRCYMFGRWK